MEETAMHEQELNVQFYVPSYIKQGLMDGTFRLFGGVVRDKGGKIIYHLKETAVKNTKNINKHNLHIILGAAILAGLAIGAFAVYKKFQPKEKIKLKEQVQSLDKNIINYFSKQSFVKLSKEDIETLLKSLVDLKDNPNFKYLELDKKTYDRLKDFCECISKNTRALESAKGFPNLPEREIEYNQPLPNLIELITIDLKRQKDILFYEDGNDFI